MQQARGFPFELCGFLFLVIMSPGLIVEMSLAFDFGVLEIVGPAPELARAVFGQGGEV